MIRSRSRLVLAFVCAAVGILLPSSLYAVLAQGATPTITLYPTFTAAPSITPFDTATIAPSNTPLPWPVGTVWQVCGAGTVYPGCTEMPPPTDFPIPCDWVSTCVTPTPGISEVITTTSPITFEANQWYGAFSPGLIASYAPGVEIDPSPSVLRWCAGYFIGGVRGHLGNDARFPFEPLVLSYSNPQTWTTWFVDRTYPGVFGGSVVTDSFSRVGHQCSIQGSGNLDVSGPANHYIHRVIWNTDGISELLLAATWYQLGGSAALQNYASNQHEFCGSSIGALSNQLSSNGQPSGVTNRVFGWYTAELQMTDNYWPGSLDPSCGLLTVTFGVRVGNIVANNVMDFDNSWRVYGLVRFSETVTRVSTVITSVVPIITGTATPVFTTTPPISIPPVPPPIQLDPPIQSCIFIETSRLNEIFPQYDGRIGNLYVCFDIYNVQSMKIPIINLEIRDFVKWLFTALLVVWLINILRK